MHLVKGHEDWTYILSVATITTGWATKQRVVALLLCAAYLSVAATTWHAKLSQTGLLLWSVYIPESCGVPHVVPDLLQRSALLLPETSSGTTIS